MQESKQDVASVLKPLTVRLPMPLARDAKVRAAQEGRPLQALVADALTAYLGDARSGRSPW